MIANHVAEVSGPGPAHERWACATSR